MTSRRPPATRCRIVDPKADAYRRHEARPLADHLDDWHSDLVARDNTVKHAKLFTDRARRVATMARAERLSDLTPARVQAALAALRDEGRSLATCNHHRAAIRGFSRWAWKDGRSRDDALVGVSGFNAREDRRHDRRTLGMDDLLRLIQKAHEGPKYRRMTGPARALCYRLAVATGLRYAEIQSTTAASFDLGGRPTVTVAAGYTKNGQPATLPLPRDLADDLARYMTGIAPEAPAFPLPGRGADMLKVDLEAAGIPYRDAAGLRLRLPRACVASCATLADRGRGVAPSRAEDDAAFDAGTDGPLHPSPDARLEDAAARPAHPPPREPHDTAPMAATGTDGQPIENGFAHYLPTGGDGTGRNPSDSDGITDSSPDPSMDHKPLQVAGFVASRRGLSAPDVVAAEGLEPPTRGL